MIRLLPLMSDSFICFLNLASETTITQQQVQHARNATPPEDPLHQKSLLRCHMQYADSSCFCTGSGSAAGL